jgi:hypothetical protein
MLSSPIYTGWIPTRAEKIRGDQDPLISEDRFQTVQQRLNGKSRRHRKLNEDFPLRGVIHPAESGSSAGWMG